MSVVGVADRSDRAQQAVIIEDLLEGEARVLGWLPVSL
jgi:hypothetical protein